MVERRGVEPLEPVLGDDPVLHEVDNQSADQTPSLCVDLRQARMTAGYDLADIAKALRIRLQYLEALEEGRFGDLPGATYATGFLRSYSDFLGLDANEMVGRLKRETSSGMEQRDLTFPMPPKEGRNPKPWLILMVLLLAGFAYGGWHVYSTDGKIATNLVSDVSNKLTEAAGLSSDKDVMVAVATESIASEEEVSVAPSAVSSDAVSEQPGIETIAGSEQSAVTTPETAAEQSPIAMAGADVSQDVAASAPEFKPLRSDSLWDSAAGSQADEPAAIVDTAAPQSGETIIIRNANAQDGTNSEEFAVASASTDRTDTPAHKPNIYGVENTDYRIAIMATADSWVQIQGPNNELLLTRILRTGDIYHVPNRSGLFMVTGNAGALEVRVDGALVESLGPIGVVRRNVSLDPQTLVAGSEADR